MAPDNPAPSLPYDEAEIARYARCIRASRQVRWDIDTDVLRGRPFDFERKFLPDSLTGIAGLVFLSEEEKRLLSQVQGRTYASVFGLVERFISVKVLELASTQRMGNQIALEGLVRFTEEELKHQEMFRRIESVLDGNMPPGYVKTADANDVALSVLRESTWAVLALTCQFDLFTQVHYNESIAADAQLCPVFRDVFRYHWLEECQHAMMDEIEWARENRRLSPEQRDSAVNDFIKLLLSVDNMLSTQADADSNYFCMILGRVLASRDRLALRATILRAYRWQYIRSGMDQPHFRRLLTGMLTPAQLERIRLALSPALAT